MSASQHKRRDGGEACEVFCSTVAATLHGLPRDALRELAGRWPSDGNPAERIVAAAMREALLRADQRRLHLVSAKPTYVL